MSEAPLKLLHAEEQWSDIEVAYLAGILDGEGCVAIYERRRKGYSDRKHMRLEIQIWNSDRRLLDWLHDTFGGTVFEKSKRNRKRRYYYWKAPKLTKNLELWRRVRHFSLIKGEQLDLLFEACELSIVQGVGKRVPEDNRRRRAEIVRLCGELKQRGVE